jgi:virginiamycin A acetyltransferase
MKRIVNCAAKAIFVLIVVPVWVLYLLESTILGRKKSFPGYSQFFSLIPGLVGNYLREAFYRLSLVHLGSQSCICFGVILSDPGARIGSGVYIGPHCNLGLCTIEDDVLLGSGIHIMSGMSQHGFADLFVPIREQKGELLNVRIGRDTWIGNNTVVGNHVGEKCVIGAAALVIREVPPFSIAVGNPAKVIRDRRNPATEMSELSPKCKSILRSPEAQTLSEG